MDIANKTAWISFEKVQEFLEFEPVGITILMALGTFLFKKIFLKNTSLQRHRHLNAILKNLLGHLILFCSMTFIFYLGKAFTGDFPQAQKLLTYFGVLTIIWGAIVFVKTARFSLAQYLFLSHMKEAVPILLVNLFSLVLSIGVAGWLATSLFGVQLAPVLATSAIFSIVLGLALQDTLGNLFAGIAMQFDKPYEIGDWIEVHYTGQKWTGQVSEITWRATSLIGFADEAINIPNRVIAQAQIANFTISQKPFCRIQLLKINYGTSIESAKNALITATKKINDVCDQPGPDVFVSEVTESWVTLKLVYFITDYGKQYLIADQVLTRALEALSNAKIELAPQRIHILTERSLT